MSAGEAKQAYLRSAGVYPSQFGGTGVSPVSPWRVGFVGLGKLGLPVALAMSLRGHDVMGYDLDPPPRPARPAPGSAIEFAPLRLAGGSRPPRRDCLRCRPDAPSAGVRRRHPAP